MLLNIYAIIRKFWVRILIIGMGFGSLVWFLIRVIPKPSRATYPCMKVTMPLASSFVTYLLGITSFTLLFRKARKKLEESKLVLALSFAFIGLVAGTITIISTQNSTWAMTLQGPQTGNEPVGVAKGINPGRVVWMHNPDATNKNCENTWGDYWHDAGNTNLSVVMEMVSDGLQYLAGTTSDASAWTAIFKYFNKTHGNGEVDYTAGEKIVIKTNNNGVGQGEENVNTSPQVCYAILDQLVNEVGVNESDISIGDPNCPMDDVTYSLLVGDFPNVTYWRANGAPAPEQTSYEALFGSDDSFADPLPQDYIDAKYMINLPVLKKHHRAGISLSSKNHFGSIAPYRNGAWHVHPSLPIPDANADDGNIDDLETLEYGHYRCFVDIMGHEDLGGKTILYLIDGLWSSVNWGHPPVMWRMAPFNNDWPNSLFLSQDPVAIESVGYDFLFNEFDAAHPTEGIDVLDGNSGPFARFRAADDFLHQAADPNNWANGISYDPEQDGSVLGSLGTHEHWNNATDKQYSRNLKTGNGIELVGTYDIPAGLNDFDYLAEGYKLLPSYPNPFTESTTLGFHLAAPSQVSLIIFNSAGELVQQINYPERMVGDYEYTWHADDLAPGQYVYNVAVQNEKGNFNLSGKVMKLN